MVRLFHSDVIVFAGRNASLGGVYRQLANLGLALHAAKTPSEVIWLLDAGVPEFAAILIDGDCASPDEVELRSHLAASYPLLRRFVMLTEPAIAEIDGCVVVDKRRIGEQVTSLLQSRRRSST